MNDAKWNYGMSALNVLKYGADTDEKTVTMANQEKTDETDKAVFSASAEAARDENRPEPAQSETAEVVEDADEAEEVEDEQELRRNRKKSFIKLMAITISLIIAIIIGTIAWFSMNKETSTSGMGVKAGGPSFELAVAGNNIGSISYSGTGVLSTNYTGTALNDFQTGPNAPDGQSGTYNKSTGGSGTFYATGGSSDVIKWRLESEYDRYDDGLGPDSQGSFTFYVVPKVSGSLTVKFSLALEGYAAEVNQNEDKSWNVSDLAKIESGDTGYDAVTYLNSHFLFFENRANTGTEQKPVYVYSDLIDKAEFEKTFNNCVVDQVIPVTIYWIWPNTIAQMSCVAENGNVATASGTVSDLQQYVVDNASNLLKGISQADAMTYMADENTEGDETTYSFDSAKATTNLITLSNGYNKADSSIGTTVKYFLLVLDAE